MSNVPIDFPADFDSNNLQPIQLGRLVIGDGVCRLMFGTDGKLKLSCEARAKSHIIFYEPSEVYGFGKEAT
jgi:hypothetical protein